MKRAIPILNNHLQQEINTSQLKNSSDLHLPLCSTVIMVSTQSLLAAGLAICASVVYGAPAATTTAKSPLCTPEAQGIVKPKNGAKITQVNDGNYDSTYVEVIYCSGQYFKTSSVDASVWLTSPGSPNSGGLLLKDVKPDNKDSSAGFYSYRFNVTIAPEDGDYATGVRTLSVYETTTGENRCLGGVYKARG